MREPLLEGILHDLGVAGHEAVLRAQCRAGPTGGELGRGDVADLGQQPVAQGRRLVGIKDHTRLYPRRAAAIAIANRSTGHPQFPRRRRGVTGQDR